jgi:hypothetical protein
MMGVAPALWLQSLIVAKAVEPIGCVGRPVLTSGPIHDRADELTGNTRASSCRSHPDRNQFNPSLSDRLSADDTDHLRRFLRQRVSGT